MTGVYGNGGIPSVNIPVCTGFISGWGCPNQANQTQPLDRTKIKVAFCKTCPDDGNPIDVRNGAKKEQMTDMDFPINVQRLYNSKMQHPGMFGIGWRSNFDKSVTIIKNQQNPQLIATLGFITNSDEEIIYTSIDGVNFTAAYSDSSNYKIVLTNSAIVLYNPDSSIEYYSLVTGKIISEFYHGKTLTYQYDSNGLLTRVTDSLGRYLQFYFSGYANVIDQITASNGDTLQYSYDSGNVATVSFNGINQITYQYSNAFGYLTGKLDGNGIQYAAFTYDSGTGKAIETKWITTDGHDLKKFEFSYSPNQTVVTQANGLSKTYSLTTLNYQTEIQSLNYNGYTEYNTFDSNNNVTYKKDFNNIYEVFTYDTIGRIINDSKDGQQISTNWDTINNVVSSTSETSSNGLRNTSYTYDSNLNVIGKTVTGIGGTMSWTYIWTNDGRILSETDPTGLVTTYSYYDVDGSAISGLLASITTNSGQSMTINSYDVRGNPTSITANGITKTITYDYKGRVLSESTAGITNTYTYDINGNMLTANMASGYQLAMTYDSASRLLGISDNMGGTASFTIDDATGEVIGTNIGQNNILVRARNKIIDSLGRTIQSWNATTKTTKSANYYSYFDKPNSTTDANGYQTGYGWDSRNNMTNYSFSNDNSSQTYDMDSNQTSQNSNNQQTTMTYDDFGRITTLSSPDSGSHTYSYSTSARTTSHTDAAGTVHSASSDLNGNPTTITHAGSSNTQTENYSYDTSGSVIGFSDNSGSTSYTRNSLEEVTNKNQTIGSKSFGVSYAYNSIGQQTSMTYPSGLVVNFSYTNGFLTGITSGGTNIVSNVQYNSLLNEAVSWSLNGNAVVVSKDADGLLTGFSDSGIFNQAITTDNEGHVLSLIDNTSNNNFNIALTYNYSLRSGTINGNSLNYYFGGNYNLYSQTDGITNYSFSPSQSNNKVVNFNDQTNYYSNAYDSNGNTTSDNRGSYAYDLKNNMISSNRTFNGLTATGTYAFNALGYRVSKNVGGQVRYFIYNESSQLIGEYDSSGNTIAEYVYFGLRPVAVKNGTSNLSIVHTDYLTTPRIITSGGSIVWQWKNDNAYGFNQAQGSIEFNLRFAGQYYDSESGFHYNIHRTYNPEFGRYMQSDPLGLAAGFNTYNYVGRNPLDRVDPTGLIWQYIIPPIVGGIIGGTVGGVLNYHTSTGVWKGIEEGAFSGAITGLGVTGAGKIIGTVLGEGVMTQVGANILGNVAGEYARQKTFHGCEEVNTNNLLLAGFSGAMLAPVFKPYILAKQNVVSWAPQGITPDLESGRWVMAGFNNIRNFSLSGIFARGYPQTNVIESLMNGSELTYPLGSSAQAWEIVKGVFGQRVIK